MFFPEINDKNMSFLRAIWVIFLLLGACTSSLYAQDLRNFLFRVDSIQISGNKITHDNIILRELEFQLGDSISPAELSETITNSRNNLHNTFLFNFVDIDYRIEGFDIIISIDLTERWYIWPVPILEIAERNLPTWLEDPSIKELNYGMYLNWNNFRGRKELLRFKARFGYKEQFELLYSKPNLDKAQKHGIKIIINQFRQHEVQIRNEMNQPVYFSNHSRYIYENFTALGGYTYRPKHYTKHHLSLSYNTLSFSEDSLRLEFTGSTEEKISWFNFDYLFEYDKRDFKIYPLHGYLFKAEFTQRGLGIIPDFNGAKSYLNLTGSINSELMPRVYFENAAKFRITKDENLPCLYSRALGYATYLRGFEYYTIDGNAYAISVNNLKYNIIPTRKFQFSLLPWEQLSKMHIALYSNVFFDLAYVEGRYYNVLGNTLPNKLLYSTGLGIDVVSYYDQVFRFEFTFNSLGEKGFFLHVETPFRRW